VRSLTRWSGKQIMPPPSAPSAEFLCAAPASAAESLAYGSLSRSTLQTLAKERGFKANAKTADLIKTLQVCVCVCVRVCVCVTNAKTADLTDTHLTLIENQAL
jgi:hypothetical protein